MHATGPRTEEGKNRSKLNAIKHGLTGQSLIFAAEEQQAYEQHCHDCREDLKPVGQIEESLARCIADDLYRALRGRAIELNQLRLLESTTGSAVTTLQPGAEKVLSNIALYLTRIDRSIRNNTKALEEAQAKRKQAEEQSRQPQAAQSVPLPEDVRNELDHLCTAKVIDETGQVRYPLLQQYLHQQGFVFSDSEMASLMKYYEQSTEEKRRRAAANKAA